MNPTDYTKPQSTRQWMSELQYIQKTLRALDRDAPWGHLCTSQWIRMKDHLADMLDKSLDMIDDMVKDSLRAETFGADGGGNLIRQGYPVWSVEYEWETIPNPHPHEDKINEDEISEKVHERIQEEVDRGGRFGFDNFSEVVDVINEDGEKDQEYIDISVEYRNDFGAETFEAQRDSPKNRMRRFSNMIEGTKKRLIEKAQTKGLSENFGEKEARKLGQWIRQNAPSHSSEERKYFEMMDNFRNWLHNLDSSSLYAESFNSYKVAPELSSYSKDELVSSKAGPQGTATYDEMEYDPIAQDRLSAESSSLSWKDFAIGFAMTGGLVYAWREIFKGWTDFGKRGTGAFSVRDENKG